MRLHELITEEKRVKLFHPTVGKVNWDYLPKITAYCLYWPKGPEAGMPLLADQSVLLDDQWQLRGDSKSKTPT